jgi:hypothetical protein
VREKGLNKKFKKLNSYKKLKFNETNAGKRVKNAGIGCFLRAPLCGDWSFFAGKMRGSGVFKKKEGTEYIFKFHKKLKLHIDFKFHMKLKFNT